jgi:hypothetical protein
VSIPFLTCQRDRSGDISELGASAGAVSLGQARLTPIVQNGAGILDQARDIRLLLGGFHSAALLAAVALVELDQRIGAVALQQVY